MNLAFSNAARHPASRLIDPREGIIDGSILSHAASGHKIETFGRLVSSQPNKRFLFRVSDQKINGNERGAANFIGEIFIVQHGVNDKAMQVL
ncbi:MAG: hypothetical protein ACLPKB_31760 [Xanthobacteraceae bacterium]